MNVRYKYSLTLLVFILVVLFSIFGLSKQSFKFYQQLGSLLPKSLEVKEAELSSLLSKNSEHEPNPAENELLTPQKGIYFGVDTELRDGGLRAFESLIGKKVAVVNYYTYWGEEKSAFNDTVDKQLWLDNKLFLITWNPSKSMLSNEKNQPEFRLKRILEGKFDNYIRSWTTATKRWGRPVMVRFAPEMNGDWLPWGSDFTTPDEYKQTYRYVVNFFKKANVKNVSWMWSPNEAGDKELMEYYPGDDYVDWIGLSGFNWGGIKSYQRWRSLSQIYAKSFQQLRRINKPIALVELGTVESKTDSSAKANWIKESFTVLEKEMPQVKMVVWYNGMSFEEYDWRVNTSKISLASFRAAISSHYFLDEIKVKE